MAENLKIELIPVNSTPANVETSIAAFNQPLADLLTHIGLPTENVLSPIEERRKVIYALENVLEILPIEEKQKAFYLSKFTVAITVGLFDGALTFLWDKTIKAIRRLAVSFDLQYFFSVAETISNKYKKLSAEEDLAAISDHDLLEISRRIGLINDINFKRLEHVNYLRNHASSAHPNQNDITGIEMLGVLEHCIRLAIIAKPDHSVIQIKTLLDNIRKNTIPDEDFPIIGKDLIKQPQERIDDFLLSIFGLYADPRQEPTLKNNIEKLVPHIWPNSLEDTKYIIGSKFGLYRKNGDIDRKDSTQKFLEVVNGLQYKDEDSLAAELIEKLQDLRTTHFEWNNFYNEYTHALSIENSLPTSGIPDATRQLFVKIITLCWIGNGKGYQEGVDTRAEPIYKKFIQNYTIKEIVDFIYLFQDQEFVTDLDKAKPDNRVRALAEFFKKKTTDSHIIKVLDLIENFPSKQIHKIATDSRFKEALKFVKKN